MQFQRNRSILSELNFIIIQVKKPSLIRSDFFFCFFQCVVFVSQLRALLWLLRGDSIKSLGSLIQCLTTLFLKKYFLISNLNLS